MCVFQYQPILYQLNVILEKTLYSIHCSNQNMYSNIKTFKVEYYEINQMHLKSIILFSKIAQYV
jgi:hypothetical protein